MARMNWTKATKDSRVAKSGSEQGAEFGDVIDKARRAAIVENRKLASASVPFFKQKKKKSKPTKNLRNETAKAEFRATAPVFEKTVAVKSATTPSKRTNRNYLGQLRSLAASEGALCAYEKAIDDYVHGARTVNTIILPEPARRLVEAILVVRLHQSEVKVDAPE